MNYWTFLYDLCIIMIDVKLIVLVICISTISGKINYCEICSHHTLCKYAMPGPSTSCKRYDKTAFLTEDDINEIVNRLNERRNFVAMGYSKLLPPAANMKKMVWSPELATFAQRWVDQCDQSSQPNKEDQCRNLRNTDVGQNIASISGATSSFNVKSFVDIWFMQTIYYSGSVSYYNQTRDRKTNYFTQLIWADTDSVGCGRARFYINHTDIDRLVCNFAPKGNIHGRPIYAIGYPATQCPERMRPDDTFEALCRFYNKENVRKFTLSMPRVSSLLRILNLSNSTVKQDMDPIRNNLKQIKSPNETVEQRNQKIRHVLYNMHGRVKHKQPLHMLNTWNQQVNVTSNPYEQEKGHSRVYHDHDSKKNEHTQYTTNHVNTEQSFGRFDYVMDTMSSYFTEDSRKHLHKQQCTRKLLERNTSPHVNINGKCTRGNQKKKHEQTTPLYSGITSTCIEQTCKSPFSEHIHHHDLCPCNTPKSTTRCVCNINCQCVKSQKRTIPQSILRSQDKTIKADTLHYYDFPNISIRSGDTLNESKDTSKREWLFSNSHSYESKRTSNVFNERIEENNERRSVNLKNNYYNNHDYSFGFNKRKKRDMTDQITFKPFWHIDEFSHKKGSQIKSLRYTTLSNKKNKLTKKMLTTVKTYSSTESITLKMKDADSVRNSFTEKYLSFDELMRLRKLGISETEANARRQANQATTVSTTTEVTANTPFLRKKHCTRKVTCTWTVSSPTGVDGSVITVDQGGDIGSRTPPGYVDGCTRTSTCTRDYMDRNKWPTSTEESSGEVTPEDEDYCEKRALDIQRRDSAEHYVTDNIKLDSNSYLNAPMTTIYPNFMSNEIDERKKQTFTYQYDMTTTPQSACICYEENDRIKRDERYYNTRMLFKYCDQDNINENQPKQELSYGDLYYLVLHKIRTAWRNNRSQGYINKCMCNIAVEFQISVTLILFLITYNLALNLFQVL